MFQCGMLTITYGITPAERKRRAGEFVQVVNEFIERKKNQTSSEKL